MTQYRHAGPRANSVRLGAELYRLRRRAGLSGRQIAAEIGNFSQASVSRVESGQQVLALPKVERWAAATEAPDEVRARLVELAEAALNEVDAHRARLVAEGLPAIQVDVASLEARAGTIRIFQPTLVPGLLQTAEYARRIFALVDLLGDADIAGATAARLERQKILFDENKRFEFVLTEEALTFRAGPADVLATQLDRIATVSTLTNVNLGILPHHAELRTLPLVGFNMYDDVSQGGEPLVTIETPHAWLTCSDQDDIAIYRDQFSQLREAAYYGDDARATLTRLASGS